MHLLIAFLTALGTVLYFLDRLGVDIGWLNPWAWRRRRRWHKQYHANPAFSLENPMDAMALLLTATARVDGDLSSEEKNELKRIFENTFKQTPQQASALLSSSTYLLGAGQEIFKRPNEVLTPCIARFSDAQKQSSLQLLDEIAAVGGGASEVQLDFIDRIKPALSDASPPQAWS